jgi:hypothetical protein
MTPPSLLSAPSTFLAMHVMKPRALHLAWSWSFPSAEPYENPILGGRIKIDDFDASIPFG